jgi:hypothetical protein
MGSKPMGGEAIDEESIQAFEPNPRDNLYTAALTGGGIKLPTTTSHL